MAIISQFYSDIANMNLTLSHVLLDSVQGHNSYLDHSAFTISIILPAIVLICIVIRLHVSKTKTTNQALLPSGPRGLPIVGK